MVVKLAFKIERTFLSNRNHRKVMNEANRRAMQWFQRYVIPRKFTSRARWEFPGLFLERTAKHQRRKQRQFGHNLPLVYTGILRDNATSPDRSPVRATYKGAKIRIRIGHNVQSETKNEIEAMSRRHQKRMTEIIEQTYAKLSTDRRFLTRKTRRSRG